MLGKERWMRDTSGYKVQADNKAQIPGTPQPQGGYLWWAQEAL